MGCSSGGLEESNAVRNVYDEGPAHTASEDNKYSSSSWTRGHLCDTLAKNLAAFCLCPESLSGAKFEGDVLICFAGEISRPCSIQDGT